ncbi:MAG: hypothetical protein ACD_81C00126G0012 [uncultured bacterium]|uniref:Protein translocase subunit SecA n=2 Tax=Candidatus Wolfeibacteriota TaxID=1752735 RepID=A0A0G1JIL2_9BACT|nr:MAG: hypothetical protein ACD_81C00126G0012 [uncultured bacterium]KKR12891.1 MAG: Protein translocase subunit SecA [Candidatus Wolfebacteria bacterium GW2011_GWC2_39_22]KKT43822.1 MAG: Protein translocase subunit SecA [Candidatus Wolfebacteria bacterium GW2011_GWE2_44_13]HBI25450.1 preprotein translocase subunit SecA [Candidatus Wolfebacteria bacterium]
MFDFLKNIFGKYDFDPLIAEINNWEGDMKQLSAEELKERSATLRDRVINQQVPLDDVMAEAFALIREASRRTLNQRHFDVQLIGGIVLHQGKIAEMRTGEGKTLTATAPVYLNALTGKGVHVVTVNDYLARRDAVWMGQIYHALGATVGCLTHDAAFIYDPSFIAPKAELAEAEQVADEARDTLGSFKVEQEFLRPVSRKEAYQVDILYGTNHEFGFDYLRDNLAYRAEDQVQRGNHYAIIDEIDSILIDEARTPLIIAAPDSESSEHYKIFARIATMLSKDDYEVDEKARSVSINDSGISKVETALSIKNIYNPENFQLVHYLEESLKAQVLFHKDKQYVVKGGEIIIVDEFTGRMMPGRRYSGGLHQAIEAKEGVQIQQESKTYAQITLQNYFRLYERIGGMTGTAQTSAEEFHKVYNLEVVSIPTNKPPMRKDISDVIFKTKAEKYRAVVDDIKQRYDEGQPVLVGTASIEHNELVSHLLHQAHIPHQVLNAKNHEREGEIIAQAGKRKAVTVATNMAGRGVDIILGGNPPTIEEGEQVRSLGGLHVIGTDRHEARRIDNQLQGRAGRQGDPGSSHFYLSLEDDLLRIFGGDRVKSFMETLNFPEGEPIESKIISKVVNEAQKKVEGLNFDARKHLLEYDDVLNKQRTLLYRQRQEVLNGNAKNAVVTIIGKIHDLLAAQAIERPALEEILINAEIVTADEIKTVDTLKEFLDAKIKALTEPAGEVEVRMRLLAIIDRLWMGHLENLEDLRESVRMRAYAQHDPLVEYRRESYHLFQDMLRNYEDWVFFNIWKLLPQLVAAAETPVVTLQPSVAQSMAGKIGRNDPCYCGSGEKYKRCHGKDLHTA